MSCGPAGSEEEAMVHDAMVPPAVCACGVNQSSPVVPSAILLSKRVMPEAMHIRSVQGIPRELTVPRVKTESACCVRVHRVENLDVFSGGDGGHRGD